MKNIKIYRVYKSVIVTIILCGLEINFLITKEHDVKIFDDGLK